MAVQASFIKTMISGSTLTTDAVDLGSSFSRIYLDVPARGLGDIYIKGAAYADGTFRRLTREQFNTITAHTDFMIASSVSNRLVPIPVQGIRFLKIETSSALTADDTFNFICGE